MLSKGISKIRRVHYTFINSVVPYKLLRWSITTLVLTCYLSTTKNICADLNTYLLAFYLVMLAINYFLPKGVSQDIETDYYED